MLISSNHLWTKSPNMEFLFTYLAVCRPFSKVYNFLCSLYRLFMLYRSYPTKAFII